MKIICVDDEELVLNLVVNKCNELEEVSEVEGFSNPLNAIKYLKSSEADIAILDIDMPEMNGISLAIRLKEINPDISIIFLTGYSHYAVEAFKIHAQGYLLKPINKEQLKNEISYAVSKKAPSKYPHILARTFGDFDLLIDGTPVSFERLKSKELLAFLVDKSGAGVTRAVAFAALYEDALYDRKMQKQFDVIIRSLKKTLKDNGVGDILEIKSGEMRINPDKLDSDLYHLIEGDARAINEYRGEYMSSYYWASITEAALSRQTEKRLDI